MSKVSRLKAAATRRIEAAQRDKNGVVVNGDRSAAIERCGTFVRLGLLYRSGDCNRCINESVVFVSPNPRIRTETVNRVIRYSEISLAPASRNAIKRSLVTRNKGSLEHRKTDYKV